MYSFIQFISVLILYAVSLQYMYYNCKFIDFYTPCKQSLGGYRNHPVCLSVQSKLNLGYNLSIKRDKAFILHIWIPYDKTYLFVPKNVDLVTLTFDLLLKKLNIDCNFWTKGDFLIQVYIPCGKTFLSVPQILTCDLDLDVRRTFENNLNLAINFELFMPPAWKVRQGHLVIGASVRPSICLSVCPSVHLSVRISVRLTNKVQYLKFGDDTVTKLGL